MTRGPWNAPAKAFLGRTAAMRREELSGGNGEHACGAGAGAATSMPVRRRRPADDLLDTAHHDGLARSTASRWTTSSTVTATNVLVIGRWEERWNGPQRDQIQTNGDPSRPGRSANNDVSVSMVHV